MRSFAQVFHKRNGIHGILIIGRMFDNGITSNQTKNNGANRYIFVKLLSNQMMSTCYPVIFLSMHAFEAMLIL